MGTLVSVIEPPKGLHWKVQVDGRDFDSEEEIMEAARNVLRGKACFMKTNFRDPKKGAKYAPSRQKHFKDGYWVYTFWFTRMRDAALFKLMSSR
jgi:hypothetical protein